jgi:hypothetical protein
MATVAQIRAGIVANLSTIPDCQISAYRKDNPTPPTLQVIGQDEMESTTFGRGGNRLVMLVQGLVGNTLDRAAQEKLDEWMAFDGATSVWAALESDRTLNGTVDGSFVQRHTGTQIFKLPNGVEAFGTTWFLETKS